MPEEHDNTIHRCSFKNSTVELFNAASLDTEPDYSRKELIRQLRILNQEFYESIAQEYSRVGIKYRGSLRLAEGLVFVLYDRTFHNVYMGDPEVYKTEVLGYANFDVDDEYDGYVCIKQLYVRSTSRKMGVGRELMERVFAYSSSALDCNKFRLGFVSSSEGTRSFYRAMGFSAEPVFEFTTRKQ